MDAKKTPVTPQEHMKEYTGKIKSKHLELKKEKDELLSALGSDQNIQKDEITNDFRTKLNNYVKELKSTSEHKAQAEKYHQEMDKVRKIFHLIFDIVNPANKEKVKEMFAASKQYLQGVDKKDWETNQNVLEKSLRKLTPDQKKQMMDKIILWAKDPKALSVEIQKLIKSNKLDKMEKLMYELQERPIRSANISGGMLIALVLITQIGLVGNIAGLATVLFGILYMAQLVFSGFTQMEKYFNGEPVLPEIASGLNKK